MDSIAHTKTQLDAVKEKLDAAITREGWSTIHAGMGKSNRPTPELPHAENKEFSVIDPFFENRWQLKYLLFDNESSGVCSGASLYKVSCQNYSFG